jgi:hypothetical protein
VLRDDAKRLEYDVRRNAYLRPPPIPRGWEEEEDVEISSLDHEDENSVDLDHIIAPWEEPEEYYARGKFEKAQNAPLPQVRMPLLEKFTRGIKIRQWKAHITHEYKARIKRWDRSRSVIISKIAQDEHEYKNLILQLDSSNARKAETAREGLKYYDHLLKKDCGRLPPQILDRLKLDQDKAVHRLDNREVILRIDKLYADIKRLPHQLRDDRRTLELDDWLARGQIVAEALDFIGPEIKGHKNPQQDHLRRQAWIMVRNVNMAVRFPYVAAGEGTTEGPWHNTEIVEMRMENLGFVCGRCNGDFDRRNGYRAHLKSALCLSCGMRVCFGCHAELVVLKQFWDWVLGSKVDGTFNLDQVL